MNKSRAWKDPRTSDGDDDNGRFSKDYNDITNMTWSNILTYQTKIKKNIIWTFWLVMKSTVRSRMDWELLSLILHAGINRKSTMV